MLDADSLDAAGQGLARAMSESDWAHSLEAEQSLLGALLLDRGAFDQIAGTVKAMDFYRAEHGSIFRCIRDMHSQGAVADFVTLTAHMATSAGEALTAAGGAAYLAALAQNTPSSLNVLRYAEIVRDRALCRRLDALGQELSKAVRAPGQRQVAELALEAQRKMGDFAASSARGLRADSAQEFLSINLPPLEVLLEPWLFQKNLVMVHARRGVGKTHLAMACAFAVASGGSYLGWKAPRPRGVLYVDGEMPMQIMQKRIGELASSAGDVPKGLRIVSPDRQDRPMPDLATASGQAEIDALVRDDTALIIVDNLSSLVRSGGAENEAESWTRVSEWMLKHRRAGRAVCAVHHSGKTGAQRGTSKREDLLDVVINLRRPPEYDESDGAVFDVYFEKARSLTGEDIEPMRAKLEQEPGGGYRWTSGAVKSATQDRIVELWEAGGVTIIDVARELGINKSHVHKTLERAMREAKLLRDYPARRKATK